MFEDEELKQLCISYIEIGKLVQRYGYGQYNGILNIIMGQVKCIDSKEDKDEKKQYLIESYRRLFVSGRGLSDFIIYDENKEVRKYLNESLYREIKKICEIMKDYI